MASCTAMYKLQPIYPQNQPIDLPNCMYKMPNLHMGACEQRNGPNGAVDIQQLEKRQEHILERLAKLKEEVDKLAKGVQSPAPSQGENLQDIVINASPDSPPYSLFVLHELLCKQLSVMTAVHVHSSVKKVPDILRNHFGHNGVGERNSHQLALTLIWKAVEAGPVLMVNAHSQSPIVGEASIARYLGRLLSPAYDECDPITATEIDNWLDVANGQLLNGNNKEKAAALRSLNSRLGKNKWLVGQDLSLADIVMWSAVHQAGQRDGVSANVKTWLLACDNNPFFASAKQFM